jgi:hypothetical protein
MKNPNQTILALALFLVILVCGCTKKEMATEPQQSQEQTFAAGKKIADQLSLQSASILKSQEAVNMVNRIKQLNAPVLNDKKLPGSFENIRLKSLPGAGYPGRPYQMEYYSSAGTLLVVDYYYYDSNFGRLTEITRYQNVSGNMNFTGGTYYSYTDYTGYGKMDNLYRTYTFDSNWHCTNYSAFRYGIFGSNELDGIDNYDMSGNWLSSKNFNYLLLPSGSLSFPYLPNNMTSGNNKTYYTYNSSELTTIKCYDLRGLYYSQNFTYGTYLVSSTASGRYNGETFTYIYQSPDVYRYSNLKAYGSYNTVMIYRFDLSKNGSFDPMYALDQHLLHL